MTADGHRGAARARTPVHTHHPPRSHVRVQHAVHAVCLDGAAPELPPAGLPRHERVGAVISIQQVSGRTGQAGCLAAALHSCLVLEEEGVLLLPNHCAHAFQLEDYVTAEQQALVVMPNSAHNHGAGGTSGTGRSRRKREGSSSRQRDRAALRICTLCQGPTERSPLRDCVACNVGWGSNWAHCIAAPKSITLAVTASSDCYRL